MATGTTASSRPTSSLVQTGITELSNAASAAARNVTRGPTTLFTITADNQKTETSNTKVWVKLYDIISNTWTPGTDKAALGFPVEAYVSSADPDNQGAGTYQVMHSRSGVQFEKGISIAGTKEAGDLATAAPGAAFAAELTHS